MLHEHQKYFQAGLIGEARGTNHRVSFGLRVNARVLKYLEAGLIRERRVLSTYISLLRLRITHQLIINIAIVQ